LIPPSTCGKTSPCKYEYESKFEDEYGEGGVKNLPRPWLHWFVFEYMPLIDEHNRARQDILRLEEHWLTKKCWFRLLTTLTAMCVEDMHRFDRNKRHKGVQPTENEAIDVINYSDLIARWLEDMPSKMRQPNRLAAGQAPSTVDKGLQRYVPENADFKTRDPTENDLKTGRKTGGSFKRQCNICKYHGVKHETTFECNRCGMPVCKVNHMDNEEESSWRRMSCFDEHHASENEHIMCPGVRQKTSFSIPMNVRLDHSRRKSKRKRS